MAYFFLTTTVLFIVRLLQLFYSTSAIEKQEYLELSSTSIASENVTNNIKDYQCIPKCSKLSTCIAVSHNSETDQCRLVESYTVLHNNSAPSWATYHKIPGTIFSIISYPLSDRGRLTGYCHSVVHPSEE